MKKHEHKAPRADKATPLPSKKHRQEKLWLLQFKWRSLKDFEEYPKDFLYQKREYSDEWQQYYFFDKFKTPQMALDNLKKDLRGSWTSRYVKGRDWRVIHKETGEEILFTELEN